MSERLHCDYCDKYIPEGTPRYEIQITSVPHELVNESIPHVHISIDLCSEECLKKTLNLGEKILEWGHIPDGFYLEKCFKDRLKK
jgi:hypothetical protein